MVWSFKYNGNGHHGYHNKNRAVKGLRHKHKLKILSRLSDLNILIFRVRVHISVLEHCRKKNLSIYVHQTLIHTKCEQC